MDTILNTDIFDHAKEPMFLGRNLSLQRYDRFKHPIFIDLFKQQNGAFWWPEEIALATDRTDYSKLSAPEKWVFDTNLKFQTLGDSCLSRPIHSLGQYVSNPELEATMNTWAAFEGIHSYSYSYLLNNVYGDSGKFFDSIMKDKKITGRAELIRGTFDKILGKSENIKKDILNCIIATNVMEGLVFYVSFACSFYFAYRGVMTGNGKIIKFIRRDENLHYAITSNILSILAKDETEGFQEEMKGFKQKAIDLYTESVSNEKIWCEYLFSKGDLLGLNAEVLGGYAEWLCDVRLKSLGIEPQFKTAANPIGGWLDSYLDSSKEQVAPQEAQLTSYKIGMGDSRIDDDEISKITL